MLAASQRADGMPTDEHLKRIDDALGTFIRATRDKFGRAGEHS